MSERLTTIADVLDTAIAELRESSASARLDAELLVSGALERPRSFLISHAGEALSPETLARIAQAIARRRRGEPVAHILGSREFWSLDLEVNPHVLIPRPETERLVEFAIDVLPAEAHSKVLDLGTGSGAVALAIAKERPNARLIATDNSAEAITVACRNAEGLGLANVSFLVGDFYEPVGAMHFDLIVSNPPYVSAKDPALAAPELKAEPRGALVPGPTGLEAIERIVARAPEHLRPGAWLALEHGSEQAAAVRALLSAAGFSTIRTLKDLANHERVTAGKK
jgi:release factor glutamine methyltransferase